MFVKSFKFNQDWGLEISSLHLLRSFADGISFINLEIGLDLFKADHKPSFDLMIVLLNFKLIELSVYYLHHRQAVAEELEPLQMDGVSAHLKELPLGKGVELAVNGESKQLHKHQVKELTP